MSSIALKLITLQNNNLYKLNNSSKAYMKNSSIENKTLKAFSKKRYKPVYAYDKGAGAIVSSEIEKKFNSNNKYKFYSNLYNKIINEENYFIFVYLLGITLFFYDPIFKFIKTFLIQFDYSLIYKLLPEKLLIFFFLLTSLNILVIRLNKGIFIISVKSYLNSFSLLFFIITIYWMFCMLIFQIYPNSFIVEQLPLNSDYFSYYKNLECNLSVLQFKINSFLLIMLGITIFNNYLTNTNEDLDFMASTLFFPVLPLLKNLVGIFLSKRFVIGLVLYFFLINLVDAIIIIYSICPQEELLPLCMPEEPKVPQLPIKVELEPVKLSFSERFPHYWKSFRLGAMIAVLLALLTGGK